MVSALLALVVAGGSGCATANRGAPGRGLTLSASFNGTTDADFARGDPKLYRAAGRKQWQERQPGLPAHVVHARGAGRTGDALRFTAKAPALVFFLGDRNIAYREGDWSGTVSFWLKTDPAGELAPGYCDPIQITPREWNDAAFFVEFEKRPAGIPFRLGAYADLKVWNPQGRDWNAIPAAEKPLVTVNHPPFRGDKWTHVAFTFTDFNTGSPQGAARLYLDGRLAGELSPRTQTFTWDPAQSLIMLGLNYIGLMDDLALYDRALTPGEIAQLAGQ